jgi:hypothetical protein
LRRDYLSAATKRDETRIGKRVQDGFARKSTTSLAVNLPEYIRFTVSLNRRVTAYGFKVCGCS